MSRRGLHILAVHAVGILLVIGITGSGVGRYGDFLGLFRKMFVLTYGRQLTSPTYSLKSGGVKLNGTAPDDSSTSRDPGNNPPPPPPIP